VTDSSPESERLPRQFGNFVLFDKIGEGGMARLYLGSQSTGLGGERLVVVKQILPILASSQEFSRLLIEEAKLAANLAHGNVVQVIDLGREADTLYIAMEYVEGFDLSELLRRCSRAKVPLPIEFSLYIVIETLRALDYAHRRKSDQGEPLGIVHRDVSPSNVLVSFDGEVKLCDFGIARAMGANPDLPSEAIQGKAGYMSPEAAAGEAVDARSDVFAAGVILWELLAGRRLHRPEGGRPPSLEQARRAEIPPLPERGLPEEARLHEIVGRALEKSPEARYASARDMLRDLEEYQAASGLLASPLRLGDWLVDHFGQEILEKRGARERAAARGSSPPKARASDPVPPPGPPASERPVAPPPPAPEPAAESQLAVAHSLREPAPEPAASGARGALLWVMIALLVVAIVIGLLLR